MKRFAFYFGLAAALVASCSIQEESFNTPLQDDIIFYASFEQPAEDGTRVYANEDLLLRWNADDRVSIFNKNTYNQQYMFTGNTGANAGGFKKVETDEFMTGNAIADVVSVYPYQESTEITEGEALTLTLPAVQHYAENTFGLGANTMVSVTSDNFLQYKNVGGYLVLKLYGDGVSVSSITLKGNNGEKLAGKATVTMPLDGVPTVTISNQATDVITLVCDTPVPLGATADESTAFWFVIPPVSFSQGFTITVIGPDGSSFEKATSTGISIERHMLKRMVPIEVELEGGLPRSTIQEVQESADGTEVRVQGLVSAISTRGFIVSEDDYHILVYTYPDSMSCAIGDRVEVSGYKETYRYVAEINHPVFSIISHDNALPELNYKDITAQIDSFYSPVNVPVSCTGVLTKEGNFYHVIVPGANRQGSLYWPIAGSIDSSLIGETVRVSGLYLSSYQSGINELTDIIMTEIEEVTDPSVQPGNEIWYTSTDGQIVTPFKADAFGVTIVSNTYENGKGVISFDGVVTQIGHSAFYGCRNLASIELPITIRTISSQAFERTGLESFHVPSENIYIGQAFAFCSQLSSFSGAYASMDGRMLVISDQVVAFAPAGLTEYAVPAGVTSIGPNSFQGAQLLSVTLPDGLLDIRNRAFEDCTSLKSIYIPSTVTEIGDNVFMDCESLTSINIPASVQVLGDPFARCRQLATFEGPFATSDHHALIFNGALKGFALGAGLSEYTIPYGVREVGAFVFHQARLNKITIPDTVEIVGWYGFNACGVSELVLPARLRSISVGAFRNNALKTITFLAVNPPTAHDGDRILDDTMNCPIFVPSESVDAYKIAEGWKNYADRIFPLEEPTLPVPEAIDLGLSVKWASFNLGASSPEGYGDYYTWGETEPYYTHGHSMDSPCSSWRSDKAGYDWEYYKWCSGSSTSLTKYNNDSQHGTVDNKTVLDSNDDVVHVKLDGNWRMPTREEEEELLENCTWEWTDNFQGTGVAGSVVTSKMTGYTDRSIFLPATGFRAGDVLELSGTLGLYWSSSLYTDDPTNASALYFGPSNVGMGGSPRSNGWPIRPVSE